MQNYEVDNRYIFLYFETSLIFYYNTNIYIVLIIPRIKNTLINRKIISKNLSLFLICRLINTI